MLSLLWKLALFYIGFLFKCIVKVKPNQTKALSWFLDAWLALRETDLSSFFLVSFIKWSFELRRVKMLPASKLKWELEFYVLQKVIVHVFQTASLYVERTVHLVLPCWTMKWLWELGKCLSGTNLGMGERNLPPPLVVNLTLTPVILAKSFPNRLQ